MKVAPYLAVGALAVIPLANFNCGQNDADIGGRNTGPAEVIDMPNHFSSIATKCDGHGHRIYESDHGNDGSGRPGGITAINDASCGGTHP